MFPRSRPKPPGRSASRPRLPALAALLTLAGMLWPQIAEAARWRIRTTSVARATHTPRSGQGLAARRLFTQGLTLSAYDLLGDQTGSLNAFADARYTVDFGLPGRLRDTAQFADDWNRAALRVGYLTWRPYDGIELRAGRQWSRGALSIRDFDGLRLRLTPRLDEATTAHLVGWFGRDVEWTNAAYNTDDFDVQGIPPEARRDGPFSAASAWLAGGRVGLSWERGGSFDISWRRRWRPASDADIAHIRDVDPDFEVDERWTGSERIGFATQLVPHRRFNVSASAAYHTLIGAVDRARLDAAWRVPGLDATATVGAEHRRPWFDASSIFNLFGPRPHQGVFGTWAHRVDALNTEFEGRGWMRIYHGAAAPAGPPLPTDAPQIQERRWGLAAAHRSRLPWLGRTWRWNSELSWETTAEGPGSDHFLGETRLRVPVVVDRLALEARAVGLAAAPAASSSRATGGIRYGVRNRWGWATSWVLGADVPISDLGHLGVWAQASHGSLRRATASLYGTLDLEFWP